MTIEKTQDLEGLRAIGRVVGLAILHVSSHLRPGISTGELDAIGGEFLAKHGARSAPMLVYAYPGHTCISVNDEAAHGIPGGRVVRAGDLVNIDISAEMDGYFADAGASFSVPPSTPEQERLLRAARQALAEAIHRARAGQLINEVGRAVERVARRAGFTVLRELAGHGVGRHIHEDPSVPNFYEPRNRERFREGAVLTIEPFLSNGGDRVREMPDGWTLATTNGRLSAQYEHTLVIQRGAPILLTQVEGSW